MHLAIGETNDAIAVCFEPCRARGVELCLIGIVVAVAVDLDNELCLIAIEIRDEMMDRMLPPDFN